MRGEFVDMTEQEKFYKELRETMHIVVWGFGIGILSGVGLFIWLFATL